MLSNVTISVVIPCLNEEVALPGVLQEMPAGIDEVIVIDNGSSDNSVSVARQYGAKCAQERTRGYGAALLAGLRQATGEIVVFLDGDRTYSAASIPALVTLMQERGLHFVSGCRFPLSDRGAMPLVNQLSNKFIAFFIRVLFGLRVGDVMSGLMVVRRSSWERFAVDNRGMGFSWECKVRAWLADGRACAEAHIPYLARIGVSKFRRVRDGMRVLGEVIMFRMKKTRFTPEKIAV